MFFSEVLPLIDKIKRRGVVRFDLKGLDTPENVTFFLSENGKNLREKSLAASLHGVPCFFSFSSFYLFPTKDDVMVRCSSVFLNSPHTHNRFTTGIGGNRERKILNKFSFSIAKINVFDCQNRYYGNRKRLICVR